MTPPSIRILLVDDDVTFRERLALAMQRRGHSLATAGHPAMALTTAQEFRPQAAIVDLKMPGGSGLDLVRALHQWDSGLRIVVLTGYGSIATALEAIRLGAADYLTKPAELEQIIHAALGIKQDAPLAVPSLDRVEWEHLHRVLLDCENNISQAARVLGIDRRSLQRKLAKYPPKF